MWSLSPRSLIQCALAAATLAACSVIPAPAHATYIPSQRIPTSSTVYRDLERLADS